MPGGRQRVLAIVPLTAAYIPVNLRDAAHVAQVKRVFAAANDHRRGDRGPHLDRPRPCSWSALAVAPCTECVTSLNQLRAADTIRKSFPSP